MYIIDPNVIGDLWVCEDCLIYIANGELPESEEESEAIKHGIEREHPYQWVADSDEESDRFSWSACDCCASGLGGVRHKCALILVKKG